MPTPPEGQWTIVAEGLGSGRLSIMSDAPNHITGTAFNRQLIGFFEQKAAIAGLSGLPQVPSGTITFVLDPNASPFHCVHRQLCRIRIRDIENLHVALHDDGGHSANLDPWLPRPGVGVMARSTATEG